jgi:hypothetical protein
VRRSLARLAIGASSLLLASLAGGLNAMDAAPVAAAAPAAALAKHYVDSVRVVYHDARGHVFVAATPADPFCSCPDDYSVQDVTIAAKTKARAVGTPFGYVTVIGSVQERIVFRSADRHVHQIWRNRGNAVWHEVDLTTASGTQARAAGDIVGWSHETGGWQYVAYRGTDGHLHVLSWQAKVKHWHDLDLTKRLLLHGKVASDPTYHADLTSVAGKQRGSEALDYRSVDGAVHQVTHVAGKWTDLDVSHAAHSKVKALGRPSGYFSGNSAPVVPLDSVLFRGADNAVYELRNDVRTTTWLTVNVSKQAKAPLAASDPSGTSAEFYDYLKPGQLVEYTDIDHHLVVLYRDMGTRDAERSVPAPPNLPWIVWDDSTSGVSHLAPVSYDFALREAWVAPDRHVWMRSEDLTYLEKVADDLTVRVHAPLATGGVSTYVVRATQS